MLARALERPASWEEVGDYVYECRVLDHGIPVFVTSYAGQRFELNGRNAVHARCFGGLDRVGSRWFVDVPLEEVERIEREVGDWRWIARKYLPPEKAREAERAPFELKRLA